MLQGTVQPSSMRLFRHGALPTLSLLLGVRASFLDSRQPVPHRLDVRDTPDVCGGGPFIVFGLAVPPREI